MQVRVQDSLRGEGGLQGNGQEGLRQGMVTYFVWLLNILNFFLLSYFPLEQKNNLFDTLNLDLEGRQWWRLFR